MYCNKKNIYKRKLKKDLKYTKKCGIILITRIWMFGRVGKAYSFIFIKEV